MTRNEAILRFQERLMDCAIQSPRKEAMKLLGIVYANLKEFISIRAVFEEENREMIMDKFFDTLAKFNNSVRTKFPGLYLSLDESEFDYRQYLRALFGESSVNDVSDALIEFLELHQKEIINNQMPIGYMVDGQFFHRDLIRAALHQWARNLPTNFDPEKLWLMNLRGALHDDSLSRATPRYELHGDIFDVAPDTSECSTDEQYVNKVIMWKSISNDTKDEEHDLQLAFIPFAQYNANAHYMPFAEEIAYSNGFAASLDDSYPVTKYSVMVINACLVGFDEIAKLILSDMKDDELPELHYEPDALKDLYFYKRIENEKNHDRFTLYRTPKEEGHLVKEMLDRFGIDPLRMKFGSEMSVRDLQNLALDYLTQKSFVRRNPIGFDRDSNCAQSDFHFRPSYSYMTLYRTGKCPDILKTPNLDDCMIRDSNLKFIVLMTCICGPNALTFVETRARDDEINNIRIYRLLKKLGGRPQVLLPGEDSEYKIHAKMWAFAEKTTTSECKSTEVLSTGNFVDSAQMGFCDTILIADSNEHPYFTDFWNYQATGKIRTDYEMAHANMLFYPPLIREKIKQEIQGSIATKFLIDQLIDDYHEKPFIFIKCNHIADPEICNLLIKAARSGVMVKVLVRTSDCLPNHVDVPNLVIHSIAGKYLEHDRWFCFGVLNDKDPERPTFLSHNDYISTADILPRNLDRRIELLALVDEDLNLCEEFWNLFYKKTDPKAGFFNIPM